MKDRYTLEELEKVLNRIEQDGTGMFSGAKASRCLIDEIHKIKKEIDLIKDFLDL